MTAEDGTFLFLSKFARLPGLARSQMQTAGRRIEIFLGDEADRFHGMRAVMASEPVDEIDVALHRNALMWRVAVEARQSVETAFPVEPAKTGQSAIHPASDIPPSDQTKSPGDRISRSA